MHRVIGEHPFFETGFEEAEALDLLRDMVRARRFDERALALQRRGWMSGYPPFEGQEASQVGAGHAMREDDWLVPTYRSNAMQLARGVPMSDLMMFRRGHAEYSSDHDLNILPQAVPIASQIPHAAGLGMARNYREEESAVLCYFGDGATSEGDFHEGLNFAGVYDAPVVFFCENNHWAISTPRNKQTASDSIAVKADAYGIEGVQVDGMDPLAVRKVVSAAMDVARDGTPVLVESLTYRRGPHTTSDDPSQYRDDVDIDLPEWRTRDPVERFVEYLTDAGVVDEDDVESLREEANEEVSDAVDHVEDIETHDPDDVFDHVYADPPPRLREQREFVRSRSE